jgi:4-methyl-5(b-hydroxyethyl)-thiazole monophosphate biosynthesis
MEKNLAEYCGSEDWATEVMENSRHIPDVPFVLDNNVLTGRGPGTAEQFAMKFVEILTDSETAQKIHDGSCQR